MSSETFCDFNNKNTPKSDKLKTNNLLLLMNRAYEKNMGVDVCDIASILQSVGFKLEQVTRTNNNESDNKDNNELKITLICGRSGLRVVYTKHDYVCDCLEDVEMDENSLKNTLQNRLLGRPLNAAKELLASLVNQDSESNINDEEFKTPMGAKHHEPIQTDWEVDPKTSPPVMTSSPIITPQSESCSFCLEKDQKIAEIISEIKKQVAINAEKIFDILPKKNNTFTKKQFRRVSDIVKPQKTPQMPRTNKSFDIKSTVKRISPKKTPRKILLESPKLVEKTVSKTPVNDKRNFVSPKRTLLKKFCSPKTGSFFTNFISNSPSNSIVERRNSIGATPIYRPINIRDIKQLHSPQGRIGSPLFKSPKVEKINTIGKPLFKPVRDLPKRINSPQPTFNKPQIKSSQSSFSERRNSIGSTPIVRTQSHLQMHLPKPCHKSPLVPMRSNIRKSPLLTLQEKVTTPKSSSKIGRPLIKEPLKSSEKPQVAGKCISRTGSINKKRSIPTLKKVDIKK